MDNSRITKGKTHPARHPFRQSEERCFWEDIAFAFINLASFLIPPTVQLCENRELWRR